MSVSPWYVAVDAVTRVTELLKDKDSGARDAAAGFLASMSKKAEGAVAVLAASAGHAPGAEPVVPCVIAAIVTMLDDGGRGLLTLSTSDFNLNHAAI
jgi:hypothetical protein